MDGAGPFFRPNLLCVNNFHAAFQVKHVAASGAVRRLLMDGVDGLDEAITFAHGRILRWFAVCTNELRASFDRDVRTLYMLCGWSLRLLVNFPNELVGGPRNSLSKFFEISSPYRRVLFLGRCIGHLNRDGNLVGTESVWRTWVRNTVKFQSRRLGDANRLFEGCLSRRNDGLQ
jgi:hypothetical protein